MERKEITSLIDWKNKNNRMPLVMKGARQRLINRTIRDARNPIIDTV